jgi:hypothetical protein
VVPGNCGFPLRLKPDLRFRGNDSGVVGAFPDKSIISAYEADPALGKLPDYVVARAIEEIITST